MLYFVCIKKKNPIGKNVLLCNFQKYLLVVICHSKWNDTNCNRQRNL